MPSAAPTARLEARISTELHAMLERAAEMQGRSLTDFVVTAVQEAAQRAIEQGEVIRLSLGDSERFAQASCPRRTPRQPWSTPSRVVLLAAAHDRTAKKLPRYPSVSAVRMGRLVVDLAFRGQGLGGALLADALDRAARAEIAAYALLVEAKDAAATAFYERRSFIALPDSPMTPFLPLATARPPA